MPRNPTEFTLRHEWADVREEIFEEVSRPDDPGKWLYQEVWVVSVADVERQWQQVLDVPQ